MKVSEVRGLALCGTMVATAVIPLSIASLPPADHLGPAAKRTANLVREVLPEGWSFFTRSPRDSFVIALDPDGHQIDLAPNVQWRWAFGLDRSSRLGGIDVERILRELDPRWWQDCEVGMNTADCSEGLPRYILRMAENPGSLCTDITLSRQQPVPWAFRGADPRVEQVALVHVRCR